MQYACDVFMLRNATWLVRHHGMQMIGSTGVDWIRRWSTMVSTFNAKSSDHSTGILSLASNSLFDSLVLHLLDSLHPNDAA